MIYVLFAPESFSMWPSNKGMVVGIYPILDNLMGGV